MNKHSSAKHMSSKMHKKQMSGYAGMGMFSQLNLNEEQKFKLSILRDEMRLEMKKLRSPKQRYSIKEFVSDSRFDKKHL